MVLLSLLIFAHGVFGIWDELIGFAMALLFMAIFIVAWVYSRRFEPELEGDERGIEQSSDSRKRPKPK